MQNVEDLSDEELIRQMVSDGNLRYFSLLHDRYEKKIYRRCYTYVKVEEEASDLTQEILIRIFMQMYSFRKEAKFSTWLYAIIHNTCIDYLRKSQRRLKKALMENLSEGLVEMVTSEDEITSDMSAELLEELLGEVGDEARLILLLKYKEKHSIKDIMLAMNLSESAVKMRLKRAKEHVNLLYHKKVKEM